jgi:hypothetical protein
MIKISATTISISIKVNPVSRFILNPSASKQRPINTENGTPEAPCTKKNQFMWMCLCGDGRLRPFAKARRGWFRLCYFAGYRCTNIDAMLITQ